MARSPSAGLDFDTFFAESCPEMMARARVLSRSWHDAEDAVQEAYVEALARWERVSGYENPGAWVYKLVCQRLWKSSKRWTRLRSLNSGEAVDRQAIEEDPQRRVEAVQVLSALAELPDRQRMVMVMHCLHRIEQHTIATELGLTRGAVAASIFKARRKLEKALGMRDTELAGLTEPSSSLTVADAAPVGGQSITRSRDPLVAALDATTSWLTQLTSHDGNAWWLGRINREAHARVDDAG